MSHTNYHHLTDETLLKLRITHRTNLADLELQAGKFGELNLPLPQLNQLRDTRSALVEIDAEFLRRAGGVLPDPPELLEIRGQIAVFEQALADFAGNVPVIARFTEQLADLREQEAAILRGRDDYAGAVRQQAQTVASDMERSRQADHASREQRHGQRERFVNRRRIELDLTLFRDRVRERDQLLDLLSDPVARVIQVIGTGGMGKTALACHTLLTVAGNDFAAQPGGAAFHAVVYHSHKDTGLSFETLLRDLARVCPDHAATINDLQRSGDYAAQAQALLELLCEVPLLLVLDNCETMMDDAGVIRDGGIAVLVDELMTPGHRWRVILTSRREVYARANRSRYARTVTLHEGLPFADAKLFLHDLDPEGRTGLPSTPDSVLEPIVARLNGRPRLLETFVALLKESIYTPAALLAQPQTLDRITEALHDWLTVAERAILRALAVWGAPAPRDGLEFLLLPNFPSLPLDRTLARLERNGVISVSGGLFSLHALDAAVALRAGAGEQGVGNHPAADPRSPTPDPQIPAVRRLHERVAEYYAGRELPSEQWRGIDDLAPQIARVEHLTAAGLHDAAAEVLRVIDGKFLLLWGYAQRIIALREPLEEQLTQADLQMNQANLLGICYYSIGGFRQAIVQYERGSAIAQAQHDRGLQGMFFGNLGSAYEALGDVKEAIDFIKQALLISQEMGDRINESTWLNNLGSAYASLGDVQQAIRFQEQALVISRESNIRQNEMNALGNLGSRYRSLGRVQQAIGLYEKSLIISHEIGGRSVTGAALGNLGLAYANLGEVQRAIELQEQALEIFREIEDKQGEGVALGNLGLAYTTLGYLQRAICFHDQALMFFREVGDRSGEGCVLGNLANCYFWLGSLDQADTLFEQAQQIHRDIDDTYGQSDALVEWGKVALAQNNPALARERYASALSFDYPQTAGRAAWGSGGAALIIGEQEQAIAHWHDAAVRCGTMGEVIEYRYVAAAVGVALAAVEPAAGPERGAEALQALRTILAERPLPLRAAECQRDLQYVAQALGGEQGLALLEEALGLLEEAQMEGQGA